MFRTTRSGNPFRHSFLSKKTGLFRLATHLLLKAHQSVNG